mmetsp:Transcript_31279/g.37224  ORF Transcript_31279/g.37224 Transcript_31279/m.37224 type:complete len:212 (-) Transcript_31279:190-825(-)
MRDPTFAPAFFAAPFANTVRTTVRSRTFSTVRPSISRLMVTSYSVPLRERLLKEGFPNIGPCCCRGGEGTSIGANVPSPPATLLFVVVVVVVALAGEALIRFPLLLPRTLLMTPPKVFPPPPGLPLFLTEETKLETNDDVTLALGTGAGIRCGESGLGVPLLVDDADSVSDVFLLFGDGGAVVGLDLHAWKNAAVASPFRDVHGGKRSGMM